MASIQNDMRARLLTTTALSQDTDEDGQLLFNGIFQNTVVDGAPAFILDNDFARLLNFGRIATENAEAAVLVEGEDARIVNFRTGSIEADSGPDAQATGIEVTGSATIRNRGEIAGEFNGVQFAGADSAGRLINGRTGEITSDSRAVDVQGNGVEVRNLGTILGTGDQRNGTVYVDDGARDTTVTNAASGTIDAGAGNQGAAIAVSLAEDGNGTVEIDNAGTVAGRGQASAADATAGDGIRLEGVRVEGGFATGLFEGSIRNSGTVTSESTEGTTGAFRAVNNVNFQGTLENEEGGLFAGAQNGVYFGTGDHSGGTFVNRGAVTSDSRAVNIDGDGLSVVNEGDILGTGDQRNGTVYADSTADGYSFANTGLVDAGEGNDGSAVSLQTGDIDGDVVSASVVNTGTFQGRGDATEGNTVGDGFRIFSSVEDATFAGLVENAGLIAGSEETEAAAGIRIDGGVSLQGGIVNSGEIRGTATAIDATEAGSVTIVNEEDGVINGDVRLGSGSDTLLATGAVNGAVHGGGGDDVLLLGEGDQVIAGGLGSDVIDGGAGIDTADFSDLDVAVEVNLGANGVGTATRDTGFTISVQNAVVAAPDQFGSAIADGAEFVEEAVAGNLYYNIHTADFLGGEIRGQLFVDSDETVGDVRTVVLSGGLDAAQEPDPVSDSTATGEATVTITQNLTTGEVSYSSELSVTGLNEADLQTPIPGVVSAIHLHNAPAGVNGPVVQDTLVDAGGTLDTEEPIAPTGVVGEDVIENQVETDLLIGIENVIGSDDGDIIVGSDAGNVLNGEAGDDILDGAGGDDILSGGEGADIFVFGEGNDVVIDFELGIDRVQLSDLGPDFDLTATLEDASQDGSDAVLSLGSDSTLRLANVDAAQLTEDDFIL